MGLVGSYNRKFVPVMQPWLLVLVGGHRTKGDYMVTIAEGVQGG